jgi:hypothetical protein
MTGSGAVMRAEPLDPQRRSAFLVALAQLLRSERQPVGDGSVGRCIRQLQTKNILSQIDGFLAQAGTGNSKLLSANIWIADMANFAEMNSVWDAWVWPGNTPARATVEAKLASPDYKVEIMVVAAR